MSKVFISYKRADRPKARIVAEVLAENGLDVWWDVDLLPGQDWEKEINAVIDQAAATVVLWTPQAVTSELVRSEVERAYKLRRLVPVQLEPTDIPEPFKEIHTENLTSWDGAKDDNRLQNILDGVRLLAGEMPSPVVHRTADEVNDVLAPPSVRIVAASH